MEKKLALCFGESACEREHTDHSHCNECNKHKLNPYSCNCPKCGGHLEILDEVNNHLLCDTCDYEYNLYGVINPGTYDELDSLADNIMKEHECGNGIDTSILEESKVEPCSQDCKECDETSHDYYNR